MMSLGDRANPNNPAYGLFGWNDTPKYAGPGYGMVLVFTMAMIMQEVCWE